MPNKKKSLFIVLLAFFIPISIIITYMIIAQTFNLSTYNAVDNKVYLPDSFIILTLSIWLLSMCYFLSTNARNKGNFGSKNVTIQKKPKIDKAFNQSPNEILKPAPIIRNKQEQLACDILRNVKYDKLEAYKAFRSITGFEYEKVLEIVDSEYDRLKLEKSRTEVYPPQPMTHGESYSPHKEKDKPLSKKKRIAENKRNAIACCPKCGSTSLSAHKKGFGIGKAVIGVAVTVTPLGLMAGNLGAKKVRITCMNCGKQFWAGKQ